MKPIELRPRFVKQVSSTKEEVKALLTQRSDGIIIKALGDHVYYSIPEESRHYWSPQLSMELIDGEQSLEIRAMFGPNPSVWLMFVFIYSFLGFLALVVFIVGTSRWNLGLSAGILWLIPVFGILTTAAFLVARAGQKLGHDEMKYLYDHVAKKIDKIEN